jgi:UPF0716 protein FxsA
MLAFVLFVLWAFAELWVVVQVAGAIGVGSTLLLLIAVSLVGAWLVKHQGLGMWRRIREQLNRGQMPGRELVDGGLILLAGALLFVPGFITDVCGLLLLLPPVRALVRTMLARRFQLRLAGRVIGPSGRVIDVYDTRATDDDGPPPSPRSLPPRS